MNVMKDIEGVDMLSAIVAAAEEIYEEDMSYDEFEVAMEMYLS